MDLVQEADSRPEPRIIKNMALGNREVEDSDVGFLTAQILNSVYCPKAGCDFASLLLICILPSQKDGYVL